MSPNSGTAIAIQYRVVLDLLLVTLLRILEIVYSNPLEGIIMSLYDYPRMMEEKQEQVPPRLSATASLSIPLDLLGPLDLSDLPDLLDLCLDLRDLLGPLDLPGPSAS